MISSKIRLQESEKIYDVVGKGIEVRKSPGAEKWWVHLLTDSPKIFDTLTLAKEYLHRHNYLKEGETLQKRKSEIA